MKELKIGIALSGGGARGCCHIGALKVLDEAGIKPYAISGVSMGALIGGLYTMGYTPAQMEAMIRNFKQTKMFDFNILKLHRNGLFKGDKVHEFIQEKAQGKLIEACDIKFCTTSVDILTGDSCVISSGNFADAIYPSLAIPCVFSPFETNGRVLVDGGLLNNLADGVLHRMGCDVIISVDAMGSYESSQRPKTTFEIAESTIYILALQNQKRIKRYSDIIITPEQDMKMYQMLKKNMLLSMQAGEIATRQALRQIEQIIKEKQHENV